MRFFPLFLVGACAVLQLLITWYWMKLGGARAFMKVLEMLHGGSAWSTFAFGLGWFWLAAPLAGLAWLLLAWRRAPRAGSAWLAGGTMLLVTLAMVYAMYPLHLMSSGA